jgi:hypothetical protein
MLNKQLRDEETTPSHNCFKKLTEDYIEKYILDLPEFGQFITAKDPIGLYKALQNKYLVATHDDIMRAENALNDTVMKDNETFQQFKRRWDNAMINYMMVECRIPVAGDSTRHTYPEMLELKTNLLGEAEFRRQYPRKQPYKRMLGYMKGL